jgi:glutamate-1-semialdehyde 2,1-aminomutase
MLFKKAEQFIPGGVDSPVRAFKAVGGNPLFIERGRGSRIIDVDGNQYIDYVCSWGPLILGHSHPQVIEALKSAAEKGTSFGAPCELEIILAEMIAEAMPSLEMVRFVSSGTEATMSAVRLARGFTGRDKIIKFEGCYHGHADGLLAKSGSGLATFSIPDSAGVPAGYAQNTIVVPYNNLKLVEQVFQSQGDAIAAVIVEPVAANMGLVLPASGFLEGLRTLTLKHGALLIFDEVISGFRVSYGGAQGLYGVVPDLTCLGKIIGGGLPVGAYGGKRQIMQLVAPVGPVYQAGTLSGNPLAMTAGIETLKALRLPGVYERLESLTSSLEKGIHTASNELGVKIQISRLSSLITMFFTADPVIDFETAKKADLKAFSRFFNKLLKSGIYWPPSQFESCFISLAHSEEDIQFTLSAIQRSLIE